jgi:hypothetical protein
VRRLTDARSYNIRHNIRYIYPVANVHLGAHAHIYPGCYSDPDQYPTEHVDLRLTDALCHIICHIICHIYSLVHFCAHAHTQPGGYGGPDQFSPEHAHSLHDPLLGRSTERLLL